MLIVQTIGHTSQVVSVASGGLSLLKTSAQILNATTHRSVAAIPCFADVLNLVS